MFKTKKIKSIFVGLGLLALALALVAVLVVKFAYDEVSQLKFPTEDGHVPLTSFMILREEEAASPLPQNPWLTLSEISPIAICAVVKAEDRKFFFHNGFDFSQIARAFEMRLKKNAKMGGSTISQQLARNLFLNSNQTYTRKLHEGLYTVLLEARFSKAELLNIYLNVIEWGDGVWGIEQAAKYYFDRNAKSLNIEQSLFLAALIASPRVPLDKQIERIRKIYARVSHQLFYSDFYDWGQYRMSRRAMDALYRSSDKTTLRSNLLEAFPDIAEEQPLSSAVSFYIENQCGYAAEIQSANRARLSRLTKGH